MEELGKYYRLDEVSNKKLVISKLKKLKSEGKIDYQIDGENLIIEDIDLEISEIEDLNDVFEKYDVFPNIDIDEDDEDRFDYYDEDEEY